MMARQLPRRRILIICCSILVLTLSGCFGSITTDVERVSRLLEGQSFSGSRVVLLEGQSMTLRFVVNKGGTPKTWGVKGEAISPDLITVHRAQDKNLYVISGARAGTAQARFRVHDHQWYTRRKVIIDVEVLPRKSWSPTSEAEDVDYSLGGAGGAPISQ